MVWWFTAVKFYYFFWELSLNKSYYFESLKGVSFFYFNSLFEIDPTAVSGCFYKSLALGANKIGVTTLFLIPEIAVHDWILGESSVLKVAKN